MVCQTVAQEGSSSRRGLRFGFGKLAGVGPGPLSVGGGRGLRGVGGRGAEITELEEGVRGPRGGGVGSKGSQSGRAGALWRGMGWLLGGPYLLTAWPRRGAAGCGSARGRLREQGAERRVSAPRRLGMGSVCAEKRAPSPGLRVRVSAAGGCPWSLRGGVCVCARGARARLEPPPSVTARGRSAAPPACPRSPRAARRPAGSACGRGAASAAKPGPGSVGGDRPPPPPRTSQAWGGGFRPMGARGRG